MRAKISLMLFVLLLAAAFLSGVPASAAGPAAEIDASGAAEGTVAVRWLAGGDRRAKVVVAGPDGSACQYGLRLDGQYETLPLTGGSGRYTVTVYRHVRGTRYAAVLSETVEAAPADGRAPFLHPNLYVDYGADGKAVQLAAALRGDAVDTPDTIDRIYRFVTENISYDREKAQSVSYGYLPDVDATLAARKGICLDIAALTAAMLRSQGIPAKLAVGSADGQYHAWLSVWSDQAGQIADGIEVRAGAWTLVDPTLGGGYTDGGTAYIEKYVY